MTNPASSALALPHYVWSWGEKLKYNHMNCTKLSEWSQHQLQPDIQITISHNSIWIWYETSKQRQMHRNSEHASFISVILMRSVLVACFSCGLDTVTSCPVLYLHPQWVRTAWCLAGFAVGRKVKKAFLCSQLKVLKRYFTLWSHGLFILFRHLKTIQNLQPTIPSSRERPWRIPWVGLPHYRQKLLLWEAFTAQGEKSKGTCTVFVGRQKPSF